MPTIADRILQPDHSNLEFSFSPFLKSQFAFGLDSNRPVCRLYLQGHCPLGNSCPEKHHTSQDRSNTRQNTIVCKHWLKALCKKGDACEFLHEYNLRRMPECYFFAKHGFCTSGEECLYRHIDPDSRHGICPWYEMGFCQLGPDCRQKHIRKAICQLYLTGFCPRGKECEEAHPKHVTPPFPPQKRGTAGVSDMQAPRTNDIHVSRNVADVECFACGKRGHFANRCPEREAWKSAG
ncbi:mRNA 3'-end-processing protein YTH1 [Neolecta irregularis DAH-3]|uniref:mRNA 3'-end-processing protein n=1 Tax=Neolecta irregularis (strain DAH-3) TaxID=1198029 RepID=A0A1U7LND5_NEOID|nr:mRNA 3'-end-processing protein YTH1 [Neolecta irregularis DAH-3]|eukprot:OLL24180.1 mRNA 3'-end-processing protein YTH1 [Neolecta irregularis DAH-3]